MKKIKFIGLLFFALINFSMFKKRYTHKTLEKIQAGYKYYSIFTEQIRWYSPVFLFFLLIDIIIYQVKEGFAGVMDIKVYYQKKKQRKRSFKMNFKEKIKYWRIKLEIFVFENIDF